MSISINPSEAITESIFRNFYGTNTFLEKASIPETYGFKSKKGTSKRGYPDFFLDSYNEYCIVVEIKAYIEDHSIAQKEVKHYMNNNNITKDIIGMAISGQNLNDLRVSIYFKLSKGKVNYIDTKKLLSLNDIKKEYEKRNPPNTISNDELIKELKKLNKEWHSMSLQPAYRSLLFSAIMIALKNSNFRSTYKFITPPSKSDSTNANIIVESSNMNKAILTAITEELHDKISNKSKKFSWEDQFAFINNLPIPLQKYKEQIEEIEKKCFSPQNNKKQDILGKAYKIFLERAGKTLDKNIILTPYHIIHFMVKLAHLTPDDVVLDTCTGSGGFLMEAMEQMIQISYLSQKFSSPEKCEENIKKHQLIGFKNDSTLFSLACSNMFLHGDGKTNLIFRSSLINDINENLINDNDDDLLAYIHALNPTKCIINPPYENNKPIVFTKQAIEYLNSDCGRLVIIMPTDTLQKDVDTTKEILTTSKLECVIKMPDQLFSEQKRIVDTSIFIFQKPHPHQISDETLFYDLEDDGHVSVQHKGRVDKDSRWDNIEKDALDVINNFKEISNKSQKTKIFDKDGNFIFNQDLKKLKATKFKQLPIEDLFTVSKGTLASQKNVNGDYPFITADKNWKKHNTYDIDDEAIVYAVDSAGSLGRTHYVNGKFIASNLCLVLRNKNNPDYPINLKFYNYYFQSIRSQIVKSLKSGKSKKTISSNYFKKFKIDYIPYKKQLEFLEQVESFNEIEQKYIQARKDFEEKIENLIDII